MIAFDCSLNACWIVAQLPGTLKVLPQANPYNVSSEAGTTASTVQTDARNSGFNVETDGSSAAATVEK